MSTRAEIDKQIHALRVKAAALTVSNGVGQSSRGGSRRRGRGGRGFPTRVPGTSNMPGPSRGPRVNSGPLGNMRLRHTESWADIASTATGAMLTYKFVPGKSGMAYLDNMAKSFERYVVNSITINYNPSVGTTTDGTIYFGVDFNVASLPTTKAQLVTHWPGIKTPIWKPITFNIPKQKIQTRTMLFTDTSTSTDVDKVPFALCLWVVGVAKAAVGEIYATYDVQFDAPTS